MSVTVKYNVHVDIKTQATKMWEDACCTPTPEKVEIKTARNQAVFCISTLRDMGMDESDYQTLINIAGTVVTEHVEFLLHRGELVGGTSDAILTHCRNKFQARSRRAKYSYVDTGLVITVMGELILPHLVELTLESVLIGLQEIRAMKSTAPYLLPASSPDSTDKEDAHAN